MTYDEGVAVWTYLGAHCTGAALSEAQVELRAVELGDVDYDVAMEGARRWVRTHKWLPSTFELRDEIFGPDMATPDMVWGELYGAVQQRGWPDPPAPGELSEAAERTLRAIGGWLALCESDVRVSQAHVLKEVAPRVIERIRREVVLGPGTAELEMPSMRIPAIEGDVDAEP